MPGQQFEYEFDQVGNRTATRAGGDEKGLNLQPATYRVNRLNQYTSRTVPGAVRVLGTGLGTNAVSVNGQPAYRKGEYFFQEVTADNTRDSVWLGLTATATNQAACTQNRFLPKSPEQFTWDADGNLTKDGRWNYTWDAENRLIRITANTAAGPQQRIAFEYDWKGRRIRKTVWNNASGRGEPAADLRYRLRQLESDRCSESGLPSADVLCLGPGPERHAGGRRGRRRLVDGLSSFCSRRSILNPLRRLRRQRKPDRPGECCGWENQLAI